MTEQYQTLASALRHLASVCDGAQSQDGQGFNGRDTGFGRSLAEQSQTRTLSVKQQLAAIKMLQTYRGQLQAAGIELPEIGNYAVYQNGNDRPKTETPKQITGRLVMRGAEIALISDYDPKLVDRARSLSNRRFDPKTKTWLAPTSIIDEVVAKFPEFQVASEIQALSDSQKQLASMSSQASSDFEIPGILGQPLPYQRAGVQFIDLAGGRGIIADEMGLGKTLQSLAYLQLHPDKRPAIIVVPASLKINWEREIAKWLSTEERIVTLGGTKPDAQALTGASIVILNWDILTHWVDTLIDAGPIVLIYDEAHYAKNSKSRRAKAAAVLAKKTEHAILLTGTPLTNRPVELFPLLNMVDPGAWPKFFPFAKRYCDAHNNGFGWDFSGASNLDELHQKIKPFMIRRTKAQVMAELPAKRRSTVAIELDPKMRREYDRSVAEARAMIEESIESGESFGAAHLAMIEKTKQIAVAAKMAQSKQWIADFLESGQKLIVFATHKSVVAELMAAFGEQAVRVTGDDSQQDRQQSVDRFQADDSVRLFVGNIKAAGVGLTLTAASGVAFLEFAWTPGDHLQAEDRAHRIGQTDSVTAWYLVAQDTIDETIVRLIQSKAGVIDQVVDGKNESDFKVSILRELAKEIVGGKSV
jgi:SWI/SNF-related matrix-associated actin-dependent regulator 1 of chromatin subfamily A